MSQDQELLIQHSTEQEQESFRQKRKIVLIILSVVAFIVAIVFLCVFLIGASGGGSGASEQKCFETALGCECENDWEYNSQTYSGCENPDGDVYGSWCKIKADGCDGKYSQLINNPEFDYQYCTADCSVDDTCIDCDGFTCECQGVKGLPNFPSPPYW